MPPRKFSVPVAEEILDMPDPRPEPDGRGILNFPILTKMTAGLRGLWVIGGGTHMGKSTLAANIVANVAARNFPTLYLDLENDTDLPKDEPARETIKRISTAYPDSAALGSLWVFRRPREFWANVEIASPPALLVVDTLQRLAEVREDRRASVDEVLRECDRFARRGFTVIVLSQTNRGTYSVPGRYKRPTLADFKESGEIEALADSAMFVWKPTEGHPPRVVVRKTRFVKEPDHELVLYRNGWHLREDITLPLREGRPAQGPTIPATLRSLMRYVDRQGGEITRGRAVDHFERKKEAKERTVEHWLKTAVEARLLAPVQGERGRYRRVDPQEQPQPAADRIAEAGVPNPA